MLKKVQNKNFKEIEKFVIQSRTQWSEESKQEKFCLKQISPCGRNDKGGTSPCPKTLGVSGFQEMLKQVQHER